MQQHTIEYYNKKCKLILKPDGNNKIAAYNYKNLKKYLAFYLLNLLIKSPYKKLCDITLTFT